MRKQQTGMKESSMSSQDAAPAPSQKKAYQPPQLTVFGPLSKLTQNGTGADKENNGHAICGGNFQKAGGASC
jgi:hypothetical protein